MASCGLQCWHSGLSAVDGKHAVYTSKLRNVTRMSSSRATLLRMLHECRGIVFFNR